MNVVLMHVVKGLYILDWDFHALDLPILLRRDVHYVVISGVVGYIHISIRHGRTTVWKNGIKHLVRITRKLNLC